MKIQQKIPTRKVSITKLKQKAQCYFNAFIRKRDQLSNGKWKCIACGKEVDKSNASHYAPVVPYASVRYDERNVHASCIACNKNYEGNSLAYRYGLINKIGVKELEELERLALREPFKKWSEDELNKIIKKYK